MKCEFCNKDTIIEVIEDFDTQELNYRNEKIIVEKVKSYKCSACGEDWIEADELSRIRREIENNKNEVLSPELITQIRLALPIKIKSELANFLCLNEKAFVKWEKGHYIPNRSNDLLLRLIAFSKENFEFVQRLHDKKFKFEQSDYYFLKTITLKDSPPQAANFGFDLSKKISQPALATVASSPATSAGESLDYAMAA